MTFTPLAIEGAWIHTPTRHEDNRGHFEEIFKISSVEKNLGRSFAVKQVNQSRSDRGVIRGVHVSSSLEGQAKYVSCTGGSLWDIVIDLRSDSSTFGKWDSILLSASNGKSVFISEGIGHAFLSLEENTIANYLCTSEYAPEFEITFNAFSPRFAIDFEKIAREHKIPRFKLSERDLNAPFFDLQKH